MDKEALYKLARSYILRCKDEYDVKGAELFRQLAEEGYAPAQLYLGVLYEKGCGVPQDYEQAKEWYTRAKQNGHENAHLFLDHLKLITKNKD